LTEYDIWIFCYSLNNGSDATKISIAIDGFSLV